MTLNRERNIVAKYLFPAVDENLTKMIDRQSMRNICKVSLAAFLFETLSILVFIAATGRKLESTSLTSLLSVGFCAVFSLLAFFISRSLVKNQNLPHSHSLAFQVIFFVVYILWGIHVDMRHYAAGEQMLTFFTVQLLVACFVMFKPVLSVILVLGAYAGLYAAAYRIRQAEGINILNFVLLAVLAAVGMCIQYHTQLYLARKEERLNTASHRDALTGLRNRLSLEEDAHTMYGKRTTAYMIDIDYFKEINDHYGHVMGDEILKDTGDILRTLYPEALWYRYGGDEFLVLSSGDASRNYAGSEYHFEKQSRKGMGKVSLSIGNAMGEPQTYDELFDLISRADKALYEVKAHTHSVEHGGHDRRRRR